ncbi:MAG TPA: hypothetical protein PKD86_15610 [Gemmatales bacterium]|nr:hypothetical protein [Gemmatales bacterium]
MSTSELAATPAPTPAPSFGLFAGQVWGILFLGLLFGSGAWRLTAKAFEIIREHPLLTTMDYLVYGGIFLLGAAKAEFLFRRALVYRTLARARHALVTPLDWLLAPFCMLSFYRPWQRKHQILSWIVVPVMVGLAVYFAVGDIHPTLKGSVDLAIGLALGYAALWYALALVRLVGWRLMGAPPERHPLPAWRGPVPGTEPTAGA